jgi:hypothetical protein
MILINEQLGLGCHQKVQSGKPTMSLELITLVMLLFVGAVVFGGILAVGLSQMPAPRMRAHRHTRPGYN